METLTVRTRAKREPVDVTPLVAEAIQRRGFREGAVCLFVPHTTAAITVNEGDDPEVMGDVRRTLERLVPERGDYRHAEGNSDAHIDTVLVGPSVVIPVSGGALVLGRWQSIFLCEFDGPRERRIHLTFLRAE
jgi:secondary thiamine-phosphate synthase enzyme